MMNHLAIIMDGNRRWAKQNGFSFTTGYKDGGIGAMRKAIEFALKKNIKFLSLYTFSLENFKRPQMEQDFIFDSLVSEGQRHLEFLHKHQIKTKFIGDAERFPEHVRPTIAMLEDSTKHYTSLQVNMLFCYGGQQELVAAIKKITKAIAAGQLQESLLSEEVIYNNLWTAGIPNPELIIRTGGAHRLSNFLLFQAAYSELYFLDCFWPDITENDLEQAIATYQSTQKNFGK